MARTAKNAASKDANVAVGDAAESSEDRPSAMKKASYHGAGKRWTKEEIQRLATLTSQDPIPPWSEIATHFPHRTPKQCRERFKAQHTLTERKKGRWTEEEDEIIRKMHGEMGNCWTKIAKFVPGRTDNDVKNRWWSQERSRLRAKNKKNNAAAAAQTKKKKPMAHKRQLSIKCTITPMKYASIGDLGQIRSAEFVEKEFNIDPMPSPHHPTRYPLLSMSDDQLMDIVVPQPVSERVQLASYDAAASLLSLKTGLTPMKDTVGGHDGSVQVVHLQEKTNCPAATNKRWTYSRPLEQERIIVNQSAFLQKENLVPRAVVASQRKFSYPSPPAMKQIKQEILSRSDKAGMNGMPFNDSHHSPFVMKQIKEEIASSSRESTVQASQCKFNHPSPTPMKKIKQEIFSPSDESGTNAKAFNATPDSPFALKQIKEEMIPPSQDIITNDNSLNTTMTDNHPRGCVWFEFSNRALLNTMHPRSNTPLKTIPLTMNQCRGVTLKTAKEIEFSPIETKRHIEKSCHLDMEMFSPVKHI